MTQIVFDNITLVRARRTDPQTSHDAAKRAERFAPSHKSRILAAMLTQPGYAGSWTPAELSAVTGLTVVQIDRRLPELQREGLIETIGEIVGGYRVWRLV